MGTCSPDCQPCPEHEKWPRCDPKVKCICNHEWQATYYGSYCHKCLLSSDIQQGIGLEVFQREKEAVPV